MSAGITKSPAPQADVRGFHARVENGGDLGATTGFRTVVILPPDARNLIARSVELFGDRRLPGRGAGMCCLRPLRGFRPIGAVTPTPLGVTVTVTAQES